MFFANTEYTGASSSLCQRVVQTLPEPLCHRRAAVAIPFLKGFLLFHGGWCSPSSGSISVLPPYRVCLLVVTAPTLPGHQKVNFGSGGCCWRKSQGGSTSVFLKPERTCYYSKEQERSSQCGQGGKGWTCILDTLKLDCFSGIGIYVEIP